MDGYINTILIWKENSRQTLDVWRKRVQDRAGEEGDYENMSG